MTHWNEKYKYDATKIAATVVASRGQKWLAAQIAQHKAGERIEIQIAMLALMVAHGEVDTKNMDPYLSGILPYRQL